MTPFEYVCGAIVLVIIVLFYVWQDREARADFRRADFHMQAGISQTIREGISRSHYLTWTGSSTGPSVLSSDGEVLARLFIDSFGGFIAAQSMEGKWTADAAGHGGISQAIREGISPTILLSQTAGSKAAVHLDVWFGHHTISLVNGPAFEWKRHGWLCDSSGDRLIRFMDNQVAVEPKAISLSELPTLVLLGSFIMFRLKLNSVDG